MYVCSDATLGVESGPSPFFKVKCLVSKKYDVPKPPDTLWPVCRKKTTTVKPRK